MNTQIQSPRLSVAETQSLLTAAKALCIAKAFAGYSIEELREHLHRKNGNFESTGGLTAEINKGSNGQIVDMIITGQRPNRNEQDLFDGDIKTFSSLTSEIIPTENISVKIFNDSNIDDYLTAPSFEQSLFFPKMQRIVFQPIIIEAKGSSDIAHILAPPILFDIRDKNLNGKTHLEVIERDFQLTQSRIIEKEFIETRHVNRSEDKGSKNKNIIETEILYINTKSGRAAYSELYEKNICKAVTRSGGKTSKGIYLKKKYIEKHICKI